MGMIPKHITEEDLRILFSTFGDIEDLTLLTGHDGVSKGAAVFSSCPSPLPFSPLFHFSTSRLRVH